MAWKKLAILLEGLLYDSSVESEHYRKMRQKLSSNMAIFVGLVAAVGGFLYGYDTGLINDILEMHYVKTHIPSNHAGFSVHERALLTAILSLGTFVGALVAPLISDRYGRKFSIILSAALVFNAGNILQIAATDVGLLCGGRAVSGLSVGILSAIVPLYQAEASPKWVRGSIVFTYQWAITWGLMIALAVCQGTRRMPLLALYRIPIGVQFLWLTLLATGMLFLPESPRYFVQRDNIPAALASLSKLRRLPDDDDDLIEELVEIKANFDYEMSFGKTTLLDVFRTGGGRHKQRLRIATGMGVHAFQQCLGINFIFYYGVNFFLSTGVKNLYLMSFFTYLVNVIFTIPGIIFIDIIGRRQLLLLGGVGMSVCNFVIAISGVSINNTETTGIVCIVFSCCFIACFASTWGGAVWAIASDIYGISIRQKAISVTVATNWIVNFVLAYITPYLIDTGHHTAALGNKIFFIWGGLNAAGTVFVYFMVYETKGLKLEEVDYMYMNCSNSRASTKFKSTVIDYAALASPHNEFDITHESEKSMSQKSPGQSGETAVVELHRPPSPSPSPPPPGQPTQQRPPQPAPLTQHLNAICPQHSPPLSDLSVLVMSTTNPVSDYDQYLQSLQLTSMSTLGKRAGSGSRQNKTSLTTSFVSSHPLLELSVAPPLKVVTAAFYQNPPSDSDLD